MDGVGEAVMAFALCFPHFVIVLYRMETKNV